VLPTLDVSDGRSRRGVAGRPGSRSGGSLTLNPGRGGPGWAGVPLPQGRVADKTEAPASPCSHDSSSGNSGERGNGNEKPD
jgi:hypothetical protein